MSCRRLNGVIINAVVGARRMPPFLLFYSFQMRSNIGSHDDDVDDSVCARCDATLNSFRLPLSSSSIALDALDINIEGEKISITCASKRVWPVRRLEFRLVDSEDDRYTNRISLLIENICGKMSVDVVVVVGAEPRRRNIKKHTHIFATDYLREPHISSCRRHMCRCIRVRHIDFLGA